MAIKSLNELIDGINKISAESNDETLSLLEDISDTYKDLTNKASDNTNWKEKYEQNDKDWRNKYRERFMNDSVDDIPEQDDELVPRRFEDLFKED